MRPATATLVCGAVDPIATIAHTVGGYLDCAAVYGNEVEVGAGLKAGFDAGVKREDVSATIHIAAVVSQH